MPVVTVEWLEGRTEGQKRQLAKALTDAFAQVAQVPKEQVWIVFRDVKRSDWAMGGEIIGRVPRLRSGPVLPRTECRAPSGRVPSGRGRHEVSASRRTKSR